MASIETNNLRRRAEQQLAQQQSAASGAEADAKKLLHELQVHQIELEIQNEELLIAQTNVEAGLKRYTELYDMAPVGYLTLGRDGTIHQLNLKAARQLGIFRAQLKQQRFSSYISADSLSVFNDFLSNVFASKTAQSCELALLPADKSPTLIIYIEAIANDDDQSCRVILLDITKRKDNEEKLKLANLVYQAIGEAIMVADADNRIVAINPAFTKLTGYTLQEAVGQSPSLLKSDRQNEAFYQMMWHALETTGHWQGEIWNRCKNGEVYPEWLNITVILGEGGQVTNYVASFSDISERKQAEAALQDSENRYRALLRDARDAILIADMNGNLEEINRACELLLGYSRDEACRMNLIQLHPAVELTRLRQYLDDFASNGHVEPIETKILCKDGRIIDVEIQPSLIRITGFKVVKWVFIDLTERKHIEKDRLEREKVQRDALIREVHHRIKNNLQSIIGILRLFADSHPETAELLNHAISQVQSVAVVHGLQGRVSLANIRACELTVAIAAGLESIWETPVTVEIPDCWVPCTITEAEAVSLALVLNELICNAVKHDKANGHVRIMLSHTPHPDSIRLTIHNTGLIPAGFGMENPTAFGTGLQLVALLLPRTGARLTWAQQDGIVVTTLDLDKPIIQLETAT